MNLLNIIWFWLKAARVHTLPMSFMSWLVVFCIAIKDGGNIPLGILALIGVMLAHLGVNLIDDYFDFKNEVGTIKSSDEKKSIKMQKGKCAYLLEGKATINQVLLVTIIYFGLAAAIGLVLMLICGWQVALIAVLASVFCLLYPKLTYWGLSEFAVGITFSPLLFSGVYFVMTKSFLWEAILISISTGLLTVVLLHVHALMDYDFDIKENKKTLCTILKSKQNAYIALVLMVLGAYINILVGIGLNIFPIQYSLTFLTLPLGLELFRQMKLHITQQEVVPVRKWWMGPMDNWESIKASNAESFMLRFYIARNVMIFFALILTFAILIS